MIGVGLVSFGVFLCAFYNNLVWFYFCLGGLAGVGMAMAHPQGFLLGQRYFKNKRATAHGLSMAGQSLGSMVLPPVLNYLIGWYSGAGAFLLWAGIILHGMIGGILLHPVSWHLKAVPASTDGSSDGQRGENTPAMAGKGARLDEDNNHTHLSSSPAVSVSIPELLEEEGDTPGDNKPASHTSATLGENENQSHSNFLKRDGRKYMPVPTVDSKEGGQEYCSHETHSSEVEDSNNISTAARFTNITTKRDKNEDGKKLNSPHDEFTEGTNKSAPTGGATNNRLHNNTDDLQELRCQINEKKRGNISTHRRKIHSTQSLDDAFDLFGSALSIDIHSRQEEEHTSDSNGGVKSDDDKVPLVLCGIKFPRLQQVFNLTILRHPIFLTAAFASVGSRLVVHNFLTFLPPLGHEIGAGDRTPYLLTLYALFEMLAKLIMSVVSDQGWLQRRYIYMAAGVVASVACFSMTVSRNLVELGLCCGLLGFSLGTIITVAPVLLVDYLGIDVLPYSFGLLLCFNGVAAALIFPLTGWLSDAFMSYRSVFYLLSGLILLPVVLWGLVPCCANTHKDKAKEHMTT